MADSRRDIIKRLCEKINSPGLIWAFDSNAESISSELISDFKQSLLEALSIIAHKSGTHRNLPNNTDLQNLPAFIAIEKIESGPLALYNLGFRPSWTSPTLSGEKYEVIFMMPDSTNIKFTTGPGGEFSVYTLWLNMRVICARNGDVNHKKDHNPFFTAQKKNPFAEQPNCNQQ